jgi:NRPS condensation-like uncharacterized protein
MEAFHSLCDGYGAMEMLKAILFRYFELKGHKMENNGLVMTASQTPDPREIEDSFIKNYTSSKRERATVKRAYHIRGSRLVLREGIGVITGRVQTSALLSLAKKCGATLTQYLAAALTFCISSTEDAKKSDKPVNICVPVNMRKICDSQTLRNFTLFFYTSAEGRMEFSELVETLKTQFETGLNKANLQRTLNANVAMERNLGLRMVPLFIKNAGIRVVLSNLDNKIKTATISNLGQVALPPSMSGMVRDFSVHLPMGSKSTHGVGVISCGGVTTISFSRSIYETDIEKLFFTFLSGEGLDISIQSNFREG